MPTCLFIALSLLAQADGPADGRGAPIVGNAPKQRSFPPPRRLEDLPPRVFPTTSDSQQDASAANEAQRIAAAHAATSAAAQAANADADGESQAGTAPADPLAAPLPLARSSSQSGEGPGRRPPPSTGRTLTTVVSSLAIVLGLFFVFVWVMRRGAPHAPGALPSEVVQVLGRAALTPRQQMQLVRVGDKLLLVAVSPTGAETLTEVTEPAEVERLAAACEASRAGSATASFRQVLSQLGREPAPGGFFGQPAAGETTGERDRESRPSRERARA